MQNSFAEYYINLFQEETFNHFLVKGCVCVNRNHLYFRKEMEIQLKGGLTSMDPRWKEIALEG